MKMNSLLVVFSRLPRGVRIPAVQRAGGGFLEQRLTVAGEGAALAAAGFSPGGKLRAQLWASWHVNSKGAEPWWYGLSPCRVSGTGTAGEGSSFKAQSGTAGARWSLPEAGLNPGVSQGTGVPPGSSLPHCRGLKGADVAGGCSARAKPPPGTPDQCNSGAVTHADPRTAL